MPEKTIEAVFDQHVGRLISLPGVVAAGIGDHEGRPCIRVFVAKLTGELRQKLPSALDGYPVIVEESGEISALGGVQP